MAMDLATIVRKTGWMHRDDPAVRFESRAATWGEVVDRASRLANALRERGVAPGDRVAVLADNLFETVEIACACALGNTPVATLYTYYSTDTTRYLLEHIGAKVLIVDAALIDRVAPHLHELPQLEQVLVVGGPSTSEAESYDDVLADADPTVPVVPAEPDDVHIIRFSSGTTGRPKGIYYTVRDWLAYNSEWRWSTPQLTERDVYLAAGSLAHLNVAFLWGMIAVGATIAPMRRFEPEEFGRLVEELGATYTAMVPTMIQKVLASPSACRRSYATLRCLTYAGSPIAPDTLRGAIELFGPVLHQMYAQSEVAPLAMLMPWEHVLDGGPDAERRLRSAGRASVNVIVSIVDDAGIPVAPGAIGEVAAWSPGAMSGIWGDPAAGAARRLPDGSVLTRDMGFLDEDGYLFLADRKDDMIISGGYNVWPSEIESFLRQQPGVESVCVFGVPHDVWGETPVAAVVRADGEDGAALDADDLIGRAGSVLGKVNRPTSVVFVDELPVSEAGKVQRSVLRAPYWSGRERGIGGS